MRGGRHVRVVKTLAAVMLCAVVSSPADAQLGRLKKAAEDLAKDKLAPKKDSASNAGAPGAARSSSSAAAARSASYTITDERIVLVLASVEPVVQQAVRLQEAKRLSTEYAKQQDATKRCIEQATRAYDPMRAGAMSDKTSAEITRLSDRASEVQARASAALAREDKRTYLATQDTAQVLMQQYALLSIGGSCSVPYMPAGMIDAQLSAKSDAAEWKLTPTSDAKATLTHTQFGRLRERIALWGMLQEDPTMKAGSDGVFSAEEQAALQAHAAEITRLTPYFRDSTLRWSTWGDVTTW